MEDFSCSLHASKLDANGAVPLHAGAQDVPCIDVRARQELGNGSGQRTRTSSDASRWWEAVGAKRCGARKSQGPNTPPATHCMIRTKRPWGVTVVHTRARRATR